MRHKGLTIWVGCLTLGLGALPTGQAAAGTLAEELAGLEQSHPRLEAARATVNSGREQARQAFAGYLPTITLSGDAGYENIRVPGRDGAHEGRRRTASLAASQRLFDGGATASTYEAATLQVGVLGSDLETNRQAVFLEAIQAYLAVLRMRDLVALAAQNEETIRRQLNLEDERVRRGSGVAVDVLQAKSRLQLARERRVAAEGSLREALTRYQQVFGRPADPATMRVPEPPLDALPATLEEVLAIAGSENPALLTASGQVAVAGEQRDVARARYLPTVSLEVAGNIERDKNMVTGERRDYSVLLKANWTVFDGFANRAGVARATFDEAAARNTQIFTGRKVEEQAEISWHALQTARERVALLENAVNIATEVFDSRQRLREAGTDDAIAVLDAENELYGARINLAGAEYDARAAVYQVLHAMGRIGSPDTLIAQNPQTLAIHR